MVTSMPGSTRQASTGAMLASLETGAEFIKSRLRCKTNQDVGIIVFYQLRLSKTTITDHNTCMGKDDIRLLPTFANNLNQGSDSECSSGIILCSFRRKLSEAPPRHWASPPPPMLSIMYTVIYASKAKLSYSSSNQIWKLKPPTPQS